ncbi:hypothetical protein BGX38DRAFT_65533 [Terfezia claveryi]|nr:hypothetical protein BGX38DRAFT_65533 [Terfezia claveryi]
MLQLPSMSAKKPRILLRIGPNRLATVINVPTDETDLESKASHPSSPFLSSREMAATPRDISDDKAAPKSSARIPSSKMAPQRQYRSKKNLRSLRNHHTGPTVVEDNSKDSLVTPPETATNSGTELKQAGQHEETDAPPRKRARREPSKPIKVDAEAKLTKKPRASRNDASVNVVPAIVQEIVLQQKNDNKRSLRSQDPTKISELAALFQEDNLPAYVAKDERIKIVDDEPDATPRLVLKKPGDGEAAEASASSSNYPPPYHASSTPGAPIPAARSAPITTFDFSQFEKKAARFTSDPLKDFQYEQPHKKHSMKEKRWRNIENEKSQQLYNKLRNELDKLKGPEWFKVLGLNRANPEAISKREQLIQSMERELSKQKRFTEELRKQKRAKADRTTSPEHLKPPVQNRRRSRSATLDNGWDDLEGEHPSKSRKTLEVKVAEKPFTSFFSKPHLRNAATKHWRKSGRHAQAFGHQLPPIPQIDFDLTFPLSMVEEVAKSRAS